jgi:hypothetical protein
MKHCVDCNHFIANPDVKTSGLCRAYPDPDPNAFLDWLVTGNGEQPERFHFAKIARLTGGVCGTDAKLFQPKRAD